MKIKYQILKEKKLLILSYSGHFDPREYLIHVAETTSLPAWKDVSKILSDFTHLILSYDKKIIDQLIQTKEQLNIQNKTHVYLVKTPMETALLHLYIKKTGEKNYNYYSTLENALVYLNLAEDRNSIAEILTKMRQEL